MTLQMWRSSRGRDDPRRVLRRLLDPSSARHIVFIGYVFYFRALGAPPMPKSRGVHHIGGTSPMVVVPRLMVGVLRLKPQFHPFFRARGRSDRPAFSAPRRP